MKVSLQKKIKISSDAEIIPHSNSLSISINGKTDVLNAKQIKKLIEILKRYEEE